MKITIETPKDNEEDEIIIRYHNLDQQLLDLIYTLNNNNNLIGYIDNKIVKLSLKDIYYIESVDNKTFAYTLNRVYEIKKKLYELENIHSDFLRISKNTIINLSKIDYIKPLFNAKFEAVLKNNEKIIISRQYVKALKEKLEV
ncbi:MAG: LytTR family transcriptional regulator DNA-binding domain-containing protein [Erysipelotrichaceae bacterium]|nr:LytTR family transcriptional regulator DNA-binding domain-containing protein [Erysipelotrichaceae bacterium]